MTFSTTWLLWQKAWNGKPAQHKWLRFERERGSEKAFFSFFLRWSCMHAMPDHPSSPHAAMAAGTLMAKTATVHMISTTASCPANMEKKPLITRHSVTHASVSHYHHLLTPFLQKKSQLTIFRYVYVSENIDISKYIIRSCFFMKRSHYHHLLPRSKKIINFWLCIWT